MWYWTLFTLRMMARVGLLAAVVVWVAGQWCGSSHTDARCGTVYLSAKTDDNSVAVAWHPAIFSMTAHETFDSVSGPGRVSDGWIMDSLILHPIIPGVMLKSRSPQFCVAQLEHWLLFLTFLITTVVTSVRWKQRKPKDDQQDQAGATEDAA